jgi:DNA-binding CsgD family transcriptional regulator/tetratricopeptide (TPR) repeat protein
MVRSDYGLGERPVSPKGSLLPGLLRLAPALPFVGRSDELAVLGGLRLRAAQDGRRIAILRGDAGSGKTRLARQVAESAAVAGACVLHGACDPSTAPPYGPFVEALEQLAEQEPGVVSEIAEGPRGVTLSALVPGLAGSVSREREEVPEHSGARFRLHAAVTDVLCAAARERPVVLVLDDLHWAEAPTLLLLRHLARTTADARLLVLATTREVGAEETPDLADALAELHRLDGVVRVRVGGLATDEIEELLRRLRPHVADDRARTLAAALAELTGGNAFLVAEVAEHLADAGLLDDMGGDVTTAALDAVGVPQGVREMIGQRMAHMAAEARDVLELAACGSRGIELAVLRLASPAGEPALLRAIDDATASRMLEELPGTRIAYRFRHELLRRAVRDRLSASRRAALHLRVATAVEAVHGADERVVSGLAFHFGRAVDLGGRERAVHFALRAAELAARSFAYREAARHLRAALDLGVDDGATRARALCDLGAALHRSAHVPEALDTYAAAAALARDMGDASLLAEAAIGLENVCWRPGIADPRALVLLEAAIAAVGEEDGPLRVRLLAGRSRAEAYRGEYETAAAVWREAVAMARRVGDPRSLAVTLFHAAWTRGGQSPTAVLASLDEARALFDSLGEDDFRHEVDGFRLSLLLEAFDAYGLRRELVRLHDEVERLGQPFYRHVFCYVGSTLALCDGRLDEAERLAGRAFELSRQFDEDASAIHGIQLFTLQRERGRLAAVAPVIRLVAAGSDEDGAWGPALALLLAELGMLEEARTALRRLCADELAGVPRGGLWLAGLVYLADACTLVGDGEIARVLYRELRGLEGKNVVIGAGVACYGAADRHLGMLAATAGDLDAAEHHLEAALEANRRLDSPTWIAHTQYELAQALRLRGGEADRARAHELLAHALATAERVGLAALAGRIREPAAPEEAGALRDGLSAREAEVLRLVAVGLSNRQVGAALHISQHTAANHIRSILLKTGCSNRTEAAAYAYRHGLVSR